MRKLIGILRIIGLLSFVLVLIINSVYDIDNIIIQYVMAALAVGPFLIIVILHLYNSYIKSYLVENDEDEIHI